MAGVFIALVVLAVWAGLSGTAPVAAQPQSPIKIGFIYPDKGPLATGSSSTGTRSATRRQAHPWSWKWSPEAFMAMTPYAELRGKWVK